MQCDARALQILNAKAARVGRQAYTSPADTTLAFLHVFVADPEKTSNNLIDLDDDSFCKRFIELTKALPIERIELAKDITCVVLADLPSAPEKLRGKTIWFGCLAHMQTPDGSPNLVLEAGQLKRSSVHRSKVDGATTLLCGARDDGEWLKAASTMPAWSDT